MKGINVYRVGVSLWGPWKFQHSKNGRGVYIVGETSEAKAKDCLTQYMHDNNLFGNIQSISQQSSPQYIPSRGQVMTSAEYDEMLKELDVPAYQFTPKITENGLKKHKYVKPSTEYRKRDVPGAFGVEDDEFDDVEFDG